MKSLVSASSVNVSASALLVVIALAAASPTTLTAGQAQSILVVRSNRPNVAEFDEALAMKARKVTGVATVEKLLLLRLRPHDVIGVEAGAPLRSVSPDGSVLVVKEIEGRAFQPNDAGKRVAVMGSGTAVEDYAGGHGGGMRHGFKIGASFVFPGSQQRIRVIGLYFEAPNSRVFLPLDTAQQLVGKKGRISHLIITAREQMLVH